MTDGQNTCDHITSDRSKRARIKLRSVYLIHSERKSKRMLATYMRRMRNNNLETRIAGSSCRPKLSDWFLFWSVSLSSHFLKDTFFEVVGLIRHFRNEKGTGAKMLPAIVFGIVTGDAPIMISYWPIFSPPESQFQKFLLFAPFPPETPVSLAYSSYG